MSSQLFLAKNIRKKEKVEEEVATCFMMFSWWEKSPLRVVCDFEEK